jgi:hypothetical protein
MRSRCLGSGLGDFVVVFGEGGSEAVGVPRCCVW